MDREEIIGIAIFVLLVAGALMSAIRKGARTRRHVTAYALRRGFTFLENGRATVVDLLQRVEPKSCWSPDMILLADDKPEKIYLFRYTESTRGGNTSPSNGFACLAEHGTGNPESPVRITVRIPVLEKMVEHRVPVGVEEFRREFTVACENGVAAAAVVNSEVQQILLEHSAGRGWNITVNLASHAVLVRSFWADNEDEWDYLINFARRLRTAMR